MTDNPIIAIKEINVWEHLTLEEKIEVLREILIKLLTKEVYE